MKRATATVRRVAGTKFSAYNRARLDGRATETYTQDCNLFWELTQAGNYAEAERAIEQATQHLRSRE